ncbi:MAG: glutamine synthetase III [Lachnospiraceae bacterium]|nr:glutamine synthetase III [Lachnospiraceae bacterium]
MMSEGMNVEEIFTSDAVTLEKMKEVLPKDVYKEVKMVMDEGGELSIYSANVVAEVMREWAVAEDYIKKKQHCGKTFAVIGRSTCVYLFIIMLRLMIAMLLKWEIRIQLAAILELLGAGIMIAFIIALIYWISVVFMKPRQHTAIRRLCIFSIISTTAVSLFGLWFGFFVFVFSLRDEKVIMIGQEKYLEVEESYGLGSAIGVSYHKVHGIFYESEEVEIDF